MLNLATSPTKTSPNKGAGSKRGDVWILWLPVSVGPALLTEVLETVFLIRCRLLVPLVVNKETSANEGDIRDTGLIPGSERSPGGGHGNPLQYSCLENCMDRGAWWATVHGVAKKRLSRHVPFSKSGGGLRLCSSNRLPGQCCWSKDYTSSNKEKAWLQANHRFMGRWGEVGWEMGVWKHCCLEFSPQVRVNLSGSGPKQGTLTFVCMCVVKSVTNFTILTVCKCTVHSVKYIHFIVKQLSRTLSSCKSDTRAY